MTAATLSRLPLSAGGALAGSLARGGLWGIALMIDGAYWVAGRFMRAPIAYSCVIAIAGFSVLAGSNALFLQTGRHPAPMFFSNPRLTNPTTTKPVVPATRPRPQAAVGIDNETTGSVGGQLATDSIGNDDVMALQKKLAALDLFEGTADGLFGRRTASAIKAFETRVGMRPSGKLTRKLLNAVAEAPIPAVVPLPAAQASVTPTATVAAVEVPKPHPAAVLAAPVATTIAALTSSGDKPVPLAPTRRTVQTLQVTSTEQAAASDTFAANSPPEASTAAPQQVTLAAAPQNAQSAEQPVAVAPAVTAEAPAALPSEQPVATADAAPVQVASIEPVTPVASDATVMAMNNVPAEAKPTPIAAATTTAALDPSATPAQRLAAQMGTLPPEATAASAIAPATISSDPGEGIGSTDPVLITKIQRGLASLGFLGAKIDGVPGEGTAKAIRNFEVFYDYRVTGLATPQLLNLLIQHGADI